MGRAVESGNALTVQDCEIAVEWMVVGMEHKGCGGIRMGPVEVHEAREIHFGEHIAIQDQNVLTERR